MEGPTCPNGHAVEHGFSFCPKCGSAVLLARCPNGHPVDQGPFVLPRVRRTDRPRSRADDAARGN
jgi:hypothetical protein